MKRVLRWATLACVAATGVVGCGNSNPPAKAPDQPVMMPPPGGPKGRAPDLPASKPVQDKP